MTTKIKLDKFIENKAHDAYCVCCNHYSEAYGEGANLLKPLLLEMTEALEFVSMPITNDNPSVEGLLETIHDDTKRAKKALNKLKDFLK